MTILHLNSYNGLSTGRPSTTHLVRSDLGRGEKTVLPSLFSAKLVIQGEEKYRIGRRSFSLTRGQLLLVPEGDLVMGTIPDQAQGACFFIPPESMTRELSALVSGDLEDDGWHRPSRVGDVPLAPVDFNLSASRFGHLFAETALYADTIDAGTEEALCSALVDLIMDFRGLAETLPGEKPETKLELARRVERARGYIMDNRDREVTLDEIARAASISRYHLSRAFKTAFGAPPMRYHQNMRLDWAREQILLGRTATDLAAALGFTTLTAFSRAFLRRHGHRPTLAV